MAYTNLALLRRLVGDPGDAAHNVLNIDVTATGTVSGFLFGTEE